MDCIIRGVKVLEKMLLFDIYVYIKTKRENHSGQLPVVLLSVTLIGPLATSSAGALWAKVRKV